MRVVVTGSHGFVGRALASELEAEGHQVVRLLRPGSKPAPRSAQWDPDSWSIDSAALEGSDAVVHLAGAGIGARPWTGSYKEKILRSRVDGTRLLAETLQRLERPPPVFASASAIGYYGDRGEETLTEGSGPGLGFRAQVCREWESATGIAAEAGIRVAHLRFGNVLGGGGGLLRPLLPAALLGVSTQFGSGGQFLSWVGLDDAVASVLTVLENESLAGGVNITSPKPVRNREFADALAKAVGSRPLIRVPKWLLLLAGGQERVKEVLLSSQRAMPQKLLNVGFCFGEPNISDALCTATGALRV